MSKFKTGDVVRATKSSCWKNPVYEDYVEGGLYEVVDIEQWYPGLYRVMTKCLRTGARNGRGEQYFVLDKDAKLNKIIAEVLDES